MTIGRTARGINKAEDAGTAHGKISSSGALQRVFPTTASSYLQFRCWIRQDTLCNRMSVTFLNEAMRSVTRFYNISHRTIRNPGPTGNPRRLGVDRRSLSENCCDAIGSLTDRARYVLKGEPDNVIAACLLTSTNTIDRTARETILLMVVLSPTRPVDGNAWCDINCGGRPGTRTPGGRRLRAGGLSPWCRLRTAGYVRCCRPRPSQLRR